MLSVLICDHMSNYDLYLFDDVVFLSTCFMMLCVDGAVGAINVMHGNECITKGRILLMYTVQLRFILLCMI